MLYRYEIKKIGEEEVLYLYLNIKSEFSKELTEESSSSEITRRTKNFIVNNNIPFKGNKVYLVVDGIVVRSIDIKDTILPVRLSPSYSNNNYLVNVKLDNGAIIEITLKEYLMGIIGSIYHEKMMLEVLKCIAILYRTYAYKCMSEDKLIDNDDIFYTYHNINDNKLIWSDQFENNVSRIEEAIIDTDCIFLSYQNKYIYPFIHVCNNGTTYPNKSYAYLSSVPSLWDLASNSSKEILDYGYEKISELLGINVNADSKIRIAKLGKDNCILNLYIDDTMFAGEELKLKLSLKSLNFRIIQYRHFIRFISFGFGHSYGLSLYGGNELALDGVDYFNILKYYFPKVKIQKYIKELPN